MSVAPAGPSWASSERPVLRNRRSAGSEAGRTFHHSDIISVISDCLRCCAKLKDTRVTRGFKIKSWNLFY